MRIVTYNTRGSLGQNNIVSTSRIVELLRPYSADILCFQEVYRNSPTRQMEDQPVMLGTGLNRQFIFQANRNFIAAGYGLGIAFRGDLIEQKKHLLPGGKEQRGALELRLRNVGGLRTLTVFCTHWGLTEEERLEQSSTLAEIVAASSGPTIVCGDLNAPSDSIPVTHLLATANLIDAGAMYDCNTFVSSNPTQRIDYILHTSDLKISAIEVIKSEASDHLPVIADIHLSID